MKPTLIKNTFLSVILLTPILFLSLSSCTHDPVGIGELDTVCFETEVLPLLQTSCGMTGCHGSGSEAEGFDVSNHQTILQAVNPGDPRSSKLYKVITDINGENMMPPDRALSLNQRTTIQVWIAQGANETQCGGGNGGGGGGTNGICFVQDILPMMVSSCGTTGCHDAVSHEEGYVLINYSTIVQNGIQPYNPNDSKIYEVVTTSGEDRMPPSPRLPLTSVQIAALRQWILDGAQNSDCPGNVCDTTGTISYSSQINPVLLANCTGCHNSTLASGGVNLQGYAQAALYAQTLRNGTPVLTGVIKKMSGFQPMPPSFSLDACNIRKIELWIEQGVTNN